MRVPGRRPGGGPLTHDRPTARPLECKHTEEVGRQVSLPYLLTSRPSHPAGTRQSVFCHRHLRPPTLRISRLAEPVRRSRWIGGYPIGSCAVERGGGGGSLRDHHGWMRASRQTSRQAGRQPCLETGFLEARRIAWWTHACAVIWSPRLGWVKELCASFCLERPELALSRAAGLGIQSELQAQAVISPCLVSQSGDCGHLEWNVSVPVRTNFTNCTLPAWQLEQALASTAGAWRWSQAEIRHLVHFFLFGDFKQGILAGGHDGWDGVSVTARGRKVRCCFGVLTECFPVEMRRG